MTDKPTIEECLLNFLLNFDTDISDPERGAVVQCKFVFHVVPTYKKERSTDSLNSIFDEFKNCTEPMVGSVAIITTTKIAESIFYIIILTAVFMILVVIIIGLLDKKQQLGIIIGLIFFFAIIYIIVGWLLIHNSFLIVSDEITNIEQVTDRCFQNTVANIETLFLTQETAINDALCAYPLICNPFNKNEEFI